MLKVWTYDHTTVTVGLETSTAHVTVRLCRPEAAKLWQYLTDLLASEGPSDAMVTLRQGDLRIEVNMSKDAIAEFDAVLIQFLELSGIGAKARGEPSTVFEHPAVRW